MNEAFLQPTTPLQKLLSQLPQIGQSDDPDEQIRSVLSPVVERALTSGSGQTPVPSDPATCPNCGGPATSDKSPYCCSLCRETAGFVRQFRASVESGQVFDPERQVALGQALWNLQGGGFPRRQMMVPKRVIAKVIERDGGVCTVCGAPATEIDHTGSG